MFFSIASFVDPRFERPRQTHVRIIFPGTVKDNPGVKLAAIAGGAKN
jgi:hypothetical protein